MTQDPRSSARRTVAMFVAVAMLGTAIGIWFASSRTDAEATRETVEAIVVSSPIAPMVAPSPPQSGARWGARSVPAEVEMRQAFTNAPNLGAFFDEALRHPESGGIFYARSASFACLSIQSMRRADDSPMEEVGRARVERARARCKELNGDASRRLHDAWRRSWRLDPAMSIDWSLHDVAEVGRPTFVEAQRALEAAIELGDPAVFGTVAPYVILRAGSFDGREIDPALRRDLSLAAIIAACDLGMECSTDFSAAYTCFLTQGCTDSVITAILRDEDFTDEQRRKIALLADRFVETARDGRLPTLFVRGPSNATGFPPSRE